MPETRAENSEQSRAGANRTPESVLREVFGFTTFRGSQRAVIEQVAAGGDAVVLIRHAPSAVPPPGNPCPLGPKG